MPPPWRKPGQPEPDPDPGDVSDHDPVIDPVHQWRMEMLIASGFTGAQAFHLLVGGADWHDAARLLHAGCDPNYVIDILT